MTIAQVFFSGIANGFLGAATSSVAYSLFEAIDELAQIDGIDDRELAILKIASFLTFGVICQATSQLANRLDPLFGNTLFKSSFACNTYIVSSRLFNSSIARYGVATSFGTSLGLLQKLYSEALQNRIFNALHLNEFHQ